MIEIDSLVVQFGGVRPIDGLSVRLEKSVIGLIGPNGAGKTTLLNVLSGFVAPASGTVRMDGDDITKVPAHRRSARGLRRTFQTDQIADDLTLWENVQAVADHVPNLTAAQARAAIGAALDHVCLAHRADRRGSELSTAERHLAEIARTLVGEPRLVMLDEPGAGMSDIESRQLERVIRTIPARFGAQVFLIDHDVALISACCLDTMVLDFGKLIAFGATSEVLTRPEVRRAYLGDAQAEATT